MRKFFFFDTETTDLWNWKLPPDDAAQPFPVQIAGRLVQEDRTVLGTFSFIVKPEGWGESQPKALETHGISQAVANQFGISLKAILTLVNRYAELADATVAHNHDFDIKIIERAMLHCQMDNKINYRQRICTKLATTDIVRLPGKFGKYKWPSLKELHEFLFKHEFDGAHDALVDVLAMERCFFEILNKYPDAIAA